MRTIKETRKLYKEILEEITKTPESWISFLDSSSWHFKYDFADKVLIYAQKPEAKACAEMEEWNKKVHRWVNKNADGIFVLSKDDNSPYPFRIVFDLSDTHNFRGTEYKLWEIKPEYEEKVIETLETSFGIEIGEDNTFIKSIINSSYNMVEDNIQDYLDSFNKYKIGSKLENLSIDELRTIVFTTMWATITYTMLTRCGIDAKKEIGMEQFEYIKYFNNSELVTTLGTATSEISKMGLREIAKTIDNLRIEENRQKRTFVNDEKQEYSNNENNIKGGNEYGIHENRGIQSTTNGNGERETSKWQIRNNEIELSKTEQETGIRDITNEYGIERTLGESTERGNRISEEDNRRISNEGEYNGRIESTRSNEVDRLNEQLQTDSRRTSDATNNIQLENVYKYDRNTDVKIIEDDETIEHLLNTIPSIKKIQETFNLYLRSNENNKENCKNFIIQTLGNAYNEYVVDNERVGYKVFEEGLCLWKGNYLKRTEETLQEWDNLVDYYIKNSLFKENISSIRDMLTENEQIQNIAEVENTSVFAFTQEEIDSVLKEGSHKVEGKFRIYEFLSRNLTSSENAEFLKNEYAIGGRSQDNNGVSEDYNSKGIVLSKGKNEEEQTLKITWKDAEKRIKELISADRYFTSLEQDEYYEWLDANGIKTQSSIEKVLQDEDYEVAKKLNKFLQEYDITSYNNNFPSENNEEENIELLIQDINDDSNLRAYIEFLKNSFEDLDYDDEMAVEARKLIVEFERRLPLYEFHIGDIVYIGTQEYEIRSITDEKVVLVDTAFPIMTKEMERAEFDKKVKESSLNDKLRTGKRIENKVKQEEQYAEENSLEDRLYKFLNEYDIFDVDEVTHEYVKDLIKDKESVTSTIDYFNEIIQAEDKDSDLSIELNNFISEIADLYEDKEQVTEIKEIEEKLVEELKANVKTKRRNKIEYFDLHPEIPQEQRSNFVIQNDDLGVGGKKEKYNRNIEAIKVLKLCEEQNRYATKEEQEILSNYVGWGGIQEAFDSRNDNWNKENKELKELLTESEYSEAQRSVLTAFYTPPVVIRSIYKALENMGLQKGNILEPSCRCR